MQKSDINALKDIRILKCNCYRISFFMESAVCPVAYTCKLTGKVMHYPYRDIRTGFSYERIAFVLTHPGEADFLIHDYITARAIALNPVARQLLQKDTELLFCRQKALPAEIILLSTVDSGSVTQLLRPEEALSAEPLSYLENRIDEPGGLPRAYFCPLTGKVMENPYKYPVTGVTYEYAAFAKRHPTEISRLIKDVVTSWAITRYREFMEKQRDKKENDGRPCRMLCP